MFKLLLQNITLAYKANKLYVISIFVTSFLDGSFNVLQSFALARLIDDLIGFLGGRNVDIKSIWFFFAVLVVRFVLQNTNYNYKDYITQVEKPKILDYLDNTITQKLSTLPTSVIEDSTFQDQMTNIQIFAKQRFADTIDQLSLLFQYFFVFLYAFIILSISNIFIAALIIAVSLPEVQYNLRFVKIYRDINQQLALERRRKNYFISQTQDIEQFFILKSYGLFGYFLHKVQALQQKIQLSLEKAYRYQRIRTLTTGTIGNLIGRFVPIGYYLFLTVTRKITVGQFQFYFNIVSNLYDGTFRFYGAFMQIAENNLYVKDLFSFLEREEEKDIIQKSLPLIDLSTIAITFDHVSFAYPGSNRLVLRDISFNIPAGERIAIVGKNGAGKSTILKLLNKFYAPTTGSIYINGINLQDIDTALWRKAISTLAQEVPHFYMPLDENVAIGNLDEMDNKAELASSLRNAELERDVEKLPEKEKTMLGKYFPGGVNLSGGQWQKVSIARSFYRDAPLIILDEPTSAIDAVSEQKIFEHIFSEGKKQTHIIVSHKFSNIRKANKILVIDEGKLLEEGTHEELLQNNGEYAQFYTIQSQAFEKRT